jgi:8-oxo-dGTP pyrophosphatase MutT (NUDIX family)
MLPRKIKVIAIIYRIKNHQKEILVFDHRDMLDAGTQIVGGTVEENENLIDALIREIKEEAGLEFNSSDFIFVGKTLYSRLDRNELNPRHYFKIQSNNLPDHFNHQVISTGEDNGLIFDYYWMSLNDAKNKLTGKFYELLDYL